MLQGRFETPEHVSTWLHPSFLRMAHKCMLSRDGGPWKASTIIWKCIVLILESNFTVPTLFSPGWISLLNYIIMWNRTKDSVMIIKNKQTELSSTSGVNQHWKLNIHAQQDTFGRSSFGVCVRSFLCNINCRVCCVLELTNCVFKSWGRRIHTVKV